MFTKFRTLRTRRFLSAPGESLFHTARPRHWPLQEMLSGRMANRYINTPVRGR